MNKFRYLIARRFTQIFILALFIGANVYGWKVLEGNLSASFLFGVVPLADPFALIQMFTAGATIAMDLILGAVIVSIFYAVIGGRAFCSWVCPINMISDASAWLRKRIGIDEVDRKKYLGKNARYWMVGVALLLSFIMGVAAFEMVSPVSIVHRGLIFGFGLGWGVVILLFIFDLFLVKHGWCSHLCPLGGFYSILGAKSIFRVKYDLDKCSSCMNCVEICPEHQVLDMITKKSEFVKKGECTLCARCIEVCNDDALNFSIKNFIKRES